MARAPLLLVVAALLAGCDLPPRSATACAFSKLAHPTMTTDPLAMGNEDQVHAATEGASSGHGN